MRAVRGCQSEAGAGCLQLAVNAFKKQISYKYCMSVLRSSKLISVFGLSKAEARLTDGQMPTLKTRIASVHLLGCVRDSPVHQTLTALTLHGHINKGKSNYTAESSVLQIHMCISSGWPEPLEKKRWLSPHKLENIIHWCGPRRAHGCILAKSHQRSTSSPSVDLRYQARLRSDEK